jgi:hypothetical protein
VRLFWFGCLCEEVTSQRRCQPVSVLQRTADPQKKKLKKECKKLKIKKRGYFNEN